MRAPSAIHDGARIRFFVSKDRPPDYSSGGLCSAFMKCILIIRPQNIAKKR